MQVLTGALSPLPNGHTKVIYSDGSCEDTTSCLVNVNRTPAQITDELAHLTDYEAISQVMTATGFDAQRSASYLIAEKGSAEKAIKYILREQKSEARLAKIYEREEKQGLASTPIHAAFAVRLI